ncbi:major histocompatibility complex class I-related gene protein-like isoform X1 [Synchiropus splendidus]|uniref:major histocompatibility complex class I-related gene protein-like isoform X1 n=1 Tax=Synchiropus splendidus TaxID=270530 RepID=UPI00237D8372|nr:major histocompatibility complex class I-related gene protein-like isoform X1 [Synchiropus splendidus]
MNRFVVLTICEVIGANAALHSLTYVATGLSGVPNVPEFIEVGLVDDVVIYRYDSDSQTTEPKQDWMTRLSSDDMEYLENNTPRCKQNQQRTKYRLIDVKERFNHSGGVHIYQWIYGCELDDKTGDFRSHYHIAYDGEDFIALDLETLTWIAAKQQAVILKHWWDNFEALNEYNDRYMNQYCRKWLKKFLHYGKSSLLRTELPSVSLLQKTPSSPIVCHATGFYPPQAKLLWTKDGEELHHGVTIEEVLPNPDGTYQMMAELKLPDPSEDWERFTCVFQLEGVEEALLTNLDKEAILTNWKPDQTIPIAVSVTALVLLVAAAAVIGVVLRRRAGQSTETDSNTTEEVLNPLKPPTEATAHGIRSSEPVDLLHEGPA